MDLYWKEGEVSTLAGSGTIEHKDGEGIEASFKWPRGVAVDLLGNVIVADSGNHCVRQIDPRGNVTTLAGTPRQEGCHDGVCSAASFNVPTGLAVLEDGSIYVADNWNDKIRKIFRDEVSTVAGVAYDQDESLDQAPFQDGSLDRASFACPTALVVAGDGSIIVADCSNHRVRRITPEGVTTLAGTGESGGRDGPVGEATLARPRGVALRRNGDILVSNEDGRVCVISPRGEVSTLVRLTRPTGLLVDCKGNAIVADYTAAQIFFCTPQGAVSVVAGVAGGGYRDGSSLEATFFNPYGLALDREGRIVVTDPDDNRVRMIALPSTKKLRAELASVCPPDGCVLGRSQRSLFEWAASLSLHGGRVTVQLLLEVPFDYPLGCPLVKFVSSSSSSSSSSSASSSSSSSFFSSSSSLDSFASEVAELLSTIWREDLTLSRALGEVLALLASKM